MTASRLLIAGLAALLAACQGSIYSRDGVTDGDTFYLAEYALYDPDPVLQAWVVYSLDLSACQLKLGGDNPARNSSFACEYAARRMLVDAWREAKGANAAQQDDYLDDLLRVDDAGFLQEYVALEFKRRRWEIPENLAIAAYKRWRKTALAGHKRERRLVGSWNFEERTAAN